MNFPVLLFLLFSTKIKNKQKAINKHDSIHQHLNYYLLTRQNCNDDDDDIALRHHQRVHSKYK